MEHVTIPLPEPRRAFVDDQVAHHGFADVAEYVAALIDADARAKAEERLRTMLLEGLEGEASEWTNADTERLRRRAVNGRR